MGTGVAFNGDSDFKFYYTQNFGCTAPNGDCKCGQAAIAPPPPPPPPSQPPLLSRPDIPEIPASPEIPAPTPTSEVSRMPAPPRRFMSPPSSVPSPQPTRFLSPSPPVASLPTPSSRVFGDFFGPFFFMLQDPSVGQPAGSGGFPSFPAPPPGFPGFSPRGSFRRDGEPISDLFDLISRDSDFSQLLEVS